MTEYLWLLHCIGTVEAGAESDFFLFRSEEAAYQHAAMLILVSFKEDDFSQRKKSVIKLIEKKKYKEAVLKSGEYADCEDFFVDRLSIQSGGYAEIFFVTRDTCAKHTK